MKDKATEIIILICQEYRITVFEFNSNYKYGELPQSRQLFCWTLHKLGWRNIDIAKATNFSPPRVKQLVNAGRELYYNLPYFKTRCDAIIKLYTS
jgi:hypothetical protein